MEEKTNEDQAVSTQDVSDKDTIKSVKLTPLNPAQTQSDKKNVNNMDLLMDIQIPILVELGKTEMLLQDVLALTQGSIVELDSLAGEPVKITIRGKTIAYGEVVVVDENFGVKIIKIAKPQDRIKSMG
ncbi:MAG: flagellar motor switch protein FliN [Candidatus Scalinduaceae bacterium]